PLFPDIYCGFQTNSISGYWPFLLTSVPSEFETNKTQTNLRIITVERTFYQEEGEKENGAEKIICKTRHCQEDNRPGCLSSGSRRKTHLQSRHDLCEGRRAGTGFLPRFAGIQAHRAFPLCGRSRLAPAARAGLRFHHRSPSSWARGLYCQ